MIISMKASPKTSFNPKEKEEKINDVLYLGYFPSTPFWKNFSY